MPFSNCNLKGAKINQMNNIKHNYNKINPILSSVDNHHHYWGLFQPLHLPIINHALWIIRIICWREYVGLNCLNHQVGFQRKNYLADQKIIRNASEFPWNLSKLALFTQCLLKPTNHIKTHFSVSAPNDSNYTHILVFLFKTPHGIRLWLNNYCIVVEKESTSDNLV